MNLQSLDWLLRVVSSVILFQTLFFKFSGASESVFIFSALGIEPWGRWLSGAIEGLAGALLLWPRAKNVGCAIAVAVMLGAIVSHLTRLGIEVQNDGGLLFGLALCVLFSCLGSLFITWKKKI